MKHRYLPHVLAALWIGSALASETGTGSPNGCAWPPFAGLSALYVGNPVVAVLRRAEPIQVCARSSGAQAQDVFIKGLLRQSRPLAFVRTHVDR